MAIGDQRAGGGKVTLSKATPSINLTRPGELQGVMRVELTWVARAKSLFRRSTPVELELGCLYELADGRTGALRAGTDTGALEFEPHILLDRDGARPGSAGLNMDLARPEAFRRVLIFALGAQAPNWAAAKGVLSLTPTIGPSVEVSLDEPVADTRSCAIALLQNAGAGVTVYREAQYLSGAMDEIVAAYRWGMDLDSARA
ncbi:Tellurium resistance [Nocardia cyriacigeorgica]|uniref:Tellurium resistance n=1 Tax=Nocardia cyriacigeorgica TaxID=135487 RepID=A0A6P1DGR0_9NOCA|nr:Tellurium resistance [Nocardia cyriacigeorgica]NEW38497.1 Tellurium resistance [Nocardia cyriacigeorgica]NEW47562.1 Tellurium resistance [Nocardia cyriacigeorgica]NEW49525.1 Tellurium resistance [Nocardia cyriacigeorgica]NEW54071.1 Tellurium resistance [Nocardia cyriacigeorgica]